MKKLISILGIAGLSALNMVNYSCKNDKPSEVPEAAPIREEAPVVREAPKPIEKKTYVVSEGDYLSGIVLNELGSKDLYGKVKDVQGLNWSNKEINNRDLYKTIEGKLVSGKDGYIDLIYPNEKLKLE